MPLEKGWVYIKGFFKYWLQYRNDRHPAKWAAFTVEPRRKILLRKKLTLLCNFSATAVISSISLHNLISRCGVWKYRHFRREGWMIRVNWF